MGEGGLNKYLLDTWVFRISTYMDGDERAQPTEIYPSNLVQQFLGRRQSHILLVCTCNEINVEGDAFAMPQPKLWEKD